MSVMDDVEILSKELDLMRQEILAEDYPKGSLEIDLAYDRLYSKGILKPPKGYPVGGVYKHHTKQFP